MSGAALTDPFRSLITGRLVMTPVSGADLPDLCALKADPRAFALMLGGVRDLVRTIDELAEDQMFWGARGIGMWSVRDRADGGFHGITGFMLRPDDLGLALRFAFWPDSRGRGLAREAAAAALRFAHERAGIARVVAVARQSNISSRAVLGGIGMREQGGFVRQGQDMLLYESLGAGGGAW